MSDEARTWLKYAVENARTASLCVDDGLINPAIQNSQQAVEKSLKAICLHAGFLIERTHSISKLTTSLHAAGLDPGLTPDECDLFDIVYLPSKYPLEGLLPDYEPDEDLARQCLGIAERVLHNSRICSKRPRGRLDHAE